MQQKHQSVVVTRRNIAVAIVKMAVSSLFIRRNSTTWYVKKLVRTCIEKGLCIFSVCSEKLGITVPVERINSRYIMIATAICNHHQENN